jgi:hypothetical protein
MGRFNHEAVAVEPTSGIVFLSEDRPDGALYRFRPDVAASLREGGVLEALGVRDHPSVDTRNWEQADAFPHGLLFEAHWIPVDALEGSADDLRYRAAERGAAVFARGEGMWFGGDAIYFLATSGGPLRKGQLWRYLPSPAEGTADEAAWPGRLELFLQPDDPSLLENGDNVTMAPWGDLIVCEDGPGEEYLVGVRPDGRTYRLARNAFSFSEFAGAVFSPDGSTLFVNIQNQGLTLAITGPW